MDFVRGNKFYFAGDEDVLKDQLINSYNIKPAHIALLLRNPSAMPEVFFEKNNFYEFYHKKLFMVDSAYKYQPVAAKIKMDYIIISKNPALQITDLNEIFDCGNYIFDASNSRWKIEKWKKECEELHLHFHSVSEQGAFVINL